MVKKRPRAICTTLVVRAFYGCTIFAINFANRCDVSTTGDPYFQFFARGNYYDSGWIIRTSCSKIAAILCAKSSKNFLQNRWKTSSKIAELVSKSLKNLLQNRQEFAPKSLENLLNNRRKTCSKIARKLARSCKRVTPKWLKTCCKSVEEEIEKTRTQSIDARRINARFQPLYGRSTAILMDTAPFRVNDAAVARPYYGSLTVTVLW